MERALLEYLANAAWQIPLLALGGWLLIQALNAGLRVRHALWLMVLAASVLLPLRGVELAPAELVRATAPAVDAAHAAAPSLSPAEMAALLAALPTSVPSASSDATASASPAGAGAPHAAATIALRMPLLHRFTIHVAPRVAHAITSLFAALVMIGFFRLLLAWAAHRELLHRSGVAELTDEQMEALRAHSNTLGIPVPEVRVSADVACPATLGSWRPVLLLPPGFLLHNVDDVEAALCHELAHIARRDYLVNFVAKLGALPVAWHPAVIYVQQQIYRTRELLCDAAAARLISSELRYAHSLLTLARAMVHAPAYGHAEAQGLFTRSTLEERIMHLTDSAPRTTFRTRALHALAGAAVMSTTLMLAASLHLTPVMASEASPRTLPAAASSHALPALGLNMPALLLASTMQEAPVPVTLPQEPAAPSIPGATPALPALPAPAAVAAPAAVPAPAAAPAPPAPPSGNFHFSFSQPDAKESNTIVIEADKDTFAAQQWANSDEFKQSMKDLRRDLQMQQNTFKMKVDKDGRMELWQKQGKEWKKVDGDWQKNSAEWARQAEAWNKNRDQFQKQIAEANKQFNNPEFQRQMEELRKQLKSEEFKRQMEQAQRTAELTRQNAELQKQMAEMRRDFQQKYAENMREYQREMQQRMKELQKELENLKKENSSK